MKWLRCNRWVARVDSHEATCDRLWLHRLWPWGLHRGHIKDIAWVTTPDERGASLGKIHMNSHSTVDLPPLLLKADPGDRFVTRLHREDVP